MKKSEKKKVKKKNWGRLLRPDPWHPNEDTAYFTAEGHGAISNDINVPPPFIVHDKKGITYESGKFTISQSGLSYISLTIYSYRLTRIEMFLNDDVV